MGTALTDVGVRNYETRDLDACRALWAELTDWHREIYASPGIGGPDPGRQFDWHLSRVGPEHIWVAETADGQVVGMAGMIPGESDAELEPMVVARAYRGSGVGTRLALTVVEAARKAGARQLLVRPVARNAPAIEFFHGLGFDVLGQIELFKDLVPEDRQIWRGGEVLAGREFRV